MSLSVICDHYIHQLEVEKNPNSHFCSGKSIKKIEKYEGISQRFYGKAASHFGWSLVQKCQS